MCACMHLYIIKHRLASGGGFGDPLERDPERVLGDILDGKETAEHAAEAYGVVVAGEPPRVLAEETARCRMRIAKARRSH